MKKWNIKTDNFRSIGVIEAETENEALNKHLKEYPKHKGQDIKVYSTKRYHYSTTGYGVFSLMGVIYASGRIEIYDVEDDSGYAIDEGSYWIPLKDEEKFRDFFDELETDFPVRIKLGHYNECEKAVSEELDIPVDKLNDKETIKKYHRQKYKERWFSLDREERVRLKETYGSEWEVDE